MSNDIIIDETIPGWTCPDKLIYLSNLAKELGPDKWIVEVGALFGRSAYALGMNKDESTLLTVIDPFPTYGVKVKEYFYGTPDIPYCYASFKSYTKDVVNMETIRGYSPLATDSFVVTPVREINLLFIDGGHTYDDVIADLEFWLPMCAKDAIIICDDYGNENCPGVKQAIDDTVKKHKLSSEIVDGIAHRNFCLLGFK